MTHSHTVVRRGRRLLAPLAVIVLAAGCVQTSAQPGPPPPPQVTVASVIERDVTEWDEFTGRLQAVDSVEVRPRVSGLIAAVRFQEGAIVRRGDPLLRSTRARSRPKSIVFAPSSLAPAPPGSVRRPSSRLPRSFAPRTPSRKRSATTRRLRAGIDGAIGSRRGRAPGGGVEPRIHEGHLADRRPRRPRDRHRRQSGLERAWRSDVAHDRRLAQSRLRLLRCRRAGLSEVLGRGRSKRIGPTERRPARHGAADRMALANDESFPRLGHLDFLDNQLDGATARFAGERSSATATVSSRLAFSSG